MPLQPTNLYELSEISFPDPTLCLLILMTFISLFGFIKLWLRKTETYVLFCVGDCDPTCKTSLVQTDSWRSPRLSSPSGSPAFSAQHRVNVQVRRHSSCLQSNQIKCRRLLTCCTRMLPPFRMEMPSWRVTVTMAPSRPKRWQPVHHCPWRQTRLKRWDLLSESHLCWRWSSGEPSLRRHGRAAWLAGTASSASPFLFPASGDGQESWRKQRAEAKGAVAAGLESGASPQTFSPFLPPPLLLLPRRSSAREHVMSGWLEEADKANTWCQVESEVPLPSYQHRRYTRDLLPKSCKYGQIINTVVKWHWRLLKLWLCSELFFRKMLNIHDSNYGDAINLMLKYCHLAAKPAYYTGLRRS